MISCKKLLAIFSVCIFLHGNAFGDDLPERIRYVRHGVPRLAAGVPNNESKTVLFDSAKPQDKPILSYKAADGYSMDAVGLIIKPSITFILQGTPDPNLGPGAGRFGQSFNFYLDFEKKLEDWGLIFFQLMSGWGDTVEPDLKLFSNVNYSSYDIGGRIKPRRYYYEHYLAEKRMTVRIGMMKAVDWFDQNNCADDSDTQFLNDSFNTSPSIEWPSSWATTFGEEVIMTLGCDDFMELRAGHFEGDADYQKLFKYGLYITQVAFRPDRFLGLDPMSKAGYYRFYGWVNNRAHSKYAAEGQAAETSEYANYGFGLSFDQMVTRTLDLFCRFGWQRPDVIPANGGANIEWSWSAGMQINGAHWKRCNDRLAFAVGQDFASKEYKDAGNPGSNEGHIELYYAWKLNSCLTISPDVQLIWNPNGVSASSKGDADPIFLYGTRVHYVF